MEERFLYALFQLDAGVEDQLSDSFVALKNAAFVE